MWFKKVPDELLVSFIQNLPVLSHQTSACARLTTLLLNASLLLFWALRAVMPRPERSVKRPMRRAGTPSPTSRLMGSKCSDLLESRWGTRRMRCVLPFGLAAGEARLLLVLVFGAANPVCPGGGGGMFGVAAIAPFAERRRLRSCGKTLAEVVFDVGLKPCETEAWRAFAAGRRRWP